MPKRTSPRDVVLAVAIIALGILVAWRAVMIPMTHDEASTWINYRHLDVWSCLSNYACWGTANNHWLNTLLLQWSAALFGESAWALRLPNILAGCGYGVVAALFSRRYTQGVIGGLGAWLALCAHVYLLDFFSLARGYGIMSFGVLWALYAFARYVEHYRSGWLLVLLTASTISILANFTALLPWAALGTGWGVWIIAQREWVVLRKHILFWACHALLLFLALRYPLKTLSGNGEFGWGAENLAGTLRDLFTNLLSGARYVGENSPVLILVVVLMGWAVTLAAALGHRNLNNRREVIVLGLVGFFNLLLIVAQQQLTGSMAPVGRKSIYLVPVIFSVLALAVGFAGKRMSLLGLFFVFVGLLHVSRILPGNARMSREWWYDAFYPELFAEILPGGRERDSIRLGTTWIFNPALSYYRMADALPIGGLVYERPLHIDSTMHYYFVEPSDTTGMSAAGFRLVKPVGPFFLFGRNGRNTAE